MVIKMKIRMMHIITKMDVGGAQKLLLDYLSYFKNDEDIDFELFVINSKTGSYYDQAIIDNEYNVTYLNYEKARTKYILINKLLDIININILVYKVLTNFQPDIVHLHITKLFKFVMVPLMICKIPVRFATLHSNPLVYKGHDLMIAKFGFKYAKIIPICVTEEQIGTARKHYHIKRFEQVYNGIDINKINAKKTQTAIARAKLMIPIEGFFIGSVGRLHPIKNHEFLFNVFLSVMQKRPDAYLLVAGDGSERERLTKLASEMNILSNIIFLGNISEMSTFYSAIDVFVLTSFYESSSLATIEAQAMNVKCVVSTGIPAETVSTKKCLRLSLKLSIDIWTSAILNLNMENEVVRPIQEFDIYSSMSKLKRVYLTYYRKET